MPCLKSRCTLFYFKLLTTGQQLTGTKSQICQYEPVNSGITSIEILGYQQGYPLLRQKGDSTNHQAFSIRKTFGRKHFVRETRKYSSTWAVND